MKIVYSFFFIYLFIVQGVFGVDPDEVKTVIEGDSVTLQTDFIEMQKDVLTDWKFNGSWIATIDKGTGKVKYSYDKLMMMFSDRLDLDQTGFLTIWNIRIKHSGEYKVEGISRTGTKSKMFNVVVKESPLKSIEDKDEIKVLSATKGNSETLHTENELQKHDLILWRFGAEGSLIAKADTEDNQTSYYGGDDGRFRGRLELGSKTGSLTITNIETEHTGEFRLKIISDRRILFKRFIVTVSGSGLSLGAVVVICVVILLVGAVAVAAGVVIYNRRKNSKLKKLMLEIMEQLNQLPKISKQLDYLSKLSNQLSEISEKELPKISEKELPKYCENLKKMSEICKEELPRISEKLKQMCEQKIPERLFKFSEQVKQKKWTDEKEISEQETCADVTQEETPRPEIREGERERFIVVEETAISKAFGAGKILRDSRGRKSIAIRAEDDEVHTQDDMKISEQETRAGVSQEETPRPEIREGERERIIYVEETPRSKVLGADKRLRDRQGKKSLVIRKTNNEDPAVQTQGSDGKAPENELKEPKEEPTGKEVNEETPLMSQKEEGGANE